MELAFDDRKLLVPGVHTVVMEAVRDHFGQFQRSDRRLRLFAKFAEYLESVKKAACGVSVVLDGSFVMVCVDEPDDIDVILVLPADWDDTANLKPYQYNLVSTRVVKKTYGFDVFTVVSGSADEAEWIEFFCQVNPEMVGSFRLARRFAKRNLEDYPMIRNDAQLEVVRRQLGHAERALDSLRERVLPKNPRNFAVYSEAYVDQINLLKAEIDEYLVRQQSALPDAKAPQSTSGQRPTNVT